MRPDEPVYGIPFPGSYLVGEDGRVTEKVFRREYQIRATGATVLRSGFGAEVEQGGSLTAESAAGGATVSATLTARRK